MWKQRHLDGMEVSPSSPSLLQSALLLMVTKHSVAMERATPLQVIQVGGGGHIIEKEMK